jgi:hypothetical protein
VWKRDVRDSVAVIVDLHFIENSRIEWEIIRPVRWLQERIDVENQDHPVWMLRTDKREPVRDIGLLV